MAEEDDCDNLPTNYLRVPPTRPSLSRTSSDTILRESPTVQQWVDRPITPPQCRAVCSSRWLRFTTTPNELPMGALNASILCADNGLSPFYNPPDSERFDLHTGEPACPIYVPKRMPPARRRRPQDSLSWSRSWATESPASHFSHGSSKSSSTSLSNSLSNGYDSSTSNSRANADGQAGSITFKRQPINRFTTASHLTVSFSESPLKAAMECELGTGDVGGENPSADRYPPAFETDSEDEASVHKGAGWNAKGGTGAAWTGQPGGPSTGFWEE